ncbi:MAG: hypothetical protein ACK5X0_08420 [Rhodospirillales bacterium]|jgi:hypothetical protein
MNDDDEDDKISRLIADSFAEAMPGIHARAEKIDREIAAFFGLQVEHLPMRETDGWSRLLATYVWAMKPEFGVENLRHMLDRKIFNESLRN